MAARDLLNERAKGMDHIRERLVGTRLGVEHCEIGWVAFMQRHADLGVVLEAADAGSVVRRAGQRPSPSAGLAAPKLLAWVEPQRVMRSSA